VTKKVARLTAEKEVGRGGRGRLRVLEYAFAGGVVQGYDIFDVRANMQGSAGVVPIDDAGRVYLVEEFIPALGSWGLSLPRGGIEPQETPQAAAKRELREEAGLCCEKLEPLWSGLVLPNASSWKVDLFLGLGVSFVNKQGGDEVGGTKTLIIPLDDAVAAVGRGEIPGVLTSLGVMLAQQRWRAKVGS
jgi:8-oxo-dGTP pyrophosphatase MutT (NUDIX family)